MIVVLSPSRTMNMAPVSGSYPRATTPRFPSETERIINGVKTFSAEELATLMKLSPNTAQSDYHYFQQFDSPTTFQKQAILAYSGAVYQKIAAKEFNEDDLLYAQQHLRIISALYGLVRPLDAIKAYRLTFSVKVPGLETNNLYRFWRARITESLINDLTDDDGILVNLASKEIFDVVNIADIPKEITIVEVSFNEYRNGTYRNIQLYSKQARGAMARYIVANRIKNPERIQQFTQEEYHFNESLSTLNKYIFTRKT